MPENRVRSSSRVLMNVQVVPAAILRRNAPGNRARAVECNCRSRTTLPRTCKNGDALFAKELPGWCLPDRTLPRRRMTMCGFVCYVSLTDRPPDRLAIERMTQLVAHRGPDDVGYFFDRNVAFGF